MKNTNTATSGQTGQFPPITQEDYQRLKGIIRDNETDSIEPEEFAEIHAELTDRYGKDHIKEATTRAKDELEAEAEKESETFYRPVQSFDFPKDAHQKAFYGVAGEITRLICEGTENKPEAVLAQFLCIVGNIIGRAPYKLQDKEHGANINVAIVGPTAAGAKGSSYDAVKRLFTAAFPVYAEERITGGHNSAEAIIQDVRDAITGIDPETGKEEIKEEEEPDKRLLIVEQELTRILNTNNRNGCNVSEVCREFYDRPDKVNAKSRRSKLEATKPHVSIIGHITPEALRESMNSVEVFNGFANRFTYVASIRTKPVPVPPVVDWTTGRPAQIVDCLQKVFLAFHPCGASKLCPPVQFDFTPAAAEKWCELYYAFDAEYAGKAGLHGAIVARWKPTVLRLALIYAALDLDTTEKGCVIDVQHVEAAAALWRYAAESAIWAFGLKSGNQHADKILKRLGRVKSMTKTELRLKCFSNRINTADLDDALSFLKNAGYADFDKEGKRERWHKVIC